MPQGFPAFSVAVDFFSGRRCKLRTPPPYGSLSPTHLRAPRKGDLNERQDTGPPCSRHARLSRRSTRCWPRPSNRCPTEKPSRLRRLNTLSRVNSIGTPDLGSTPGTDWRPTWIDGPSCDSSLVATAGAGMLTTADMVTARAAEPGSGPYGSIEGIAPDANGLILPEGFTSRVVAVAGDPVAGTDHLWHLFPDGAATFPDGDAGWYYACNSEVFNFMTGFENHGGASSVHFDVNGEILDAFPILSGSHSNCSGGPTPWGTWLSCEEGFFPPAWGRVWECDPTGEGEAIARDAMGFFAHEAVAVDPEEGMLYLTEDSKGGVLYRFTPDAYPDLSAGRLEAMIVVEDSVTWGEVADPTGRLCSDPRTGTRGIRDTRRGGNLVPRRLDLVHYQNRQPGPCRRPSQPAIRVGMGRQWRPAASHRGGQHHRRRGLR